MESCPTCSEENSMKHNSFARQRNRWTKALVIAILISLDLAPIRAQEIPIPPREAAPCIVCSRPRATQLEPTAGKGKTWVINSGSHFRLPPPPDGLAQGIEIGNLINRANRRDAATLNAISFWDAGPPGYRWNEIATNLMVRNNITGPRGARILSLLN